MLRVFEKILNKHNLEHLNSNRIFMASQHGFLNGKSIETNMLECINDWTAATDENKTIDAIYFDFAKAFDRVSHPKLIHRLESIGIHDKVIS